MLLQLVVYPTTHIQPLARRLRRADRALSPWRGSAQAPWGLGAPRGGGERDALNLPLLGAKRRSVLSPGDRKPPHPSPRPRGKLEQPAAHAAHPLCQGASGPGCVWPLFCLPGGDFLPIIYRQAPAAAARWMLCSLVQQPPICPQSPPGTSPGCKMLSLARTSQHRPPRIDAAPVESQAGMTHDAQQRSLPAWRALPDVAAKCEIQPFSPFLLLWGCALAAREWENEGGGGKADEGEGQAEISPPLTCPVSHCVGW